MLLQLKTIYDFLFIFKLVTTNLQKEDLLSQISNAPYVEGACVICSKILAENEELRRSHYLKHWESSCNITYEGKTLHLFCY